MSKDSESVGVSRSKTVVLTGMSGAGKQLASRFFEDMLWRVVDNLPPRLLPLVVEGAPEQPREGSSHASETPPLCVVCDVRGGCIGDLLPALDRLTLQASLPAPPVVLFLDATDEELVHRFKETRRTHPLFLSETGILPAISRERDILAEIKERADTVVDTTGLSPIGLRGRLQDMFSEQHTRRQHPLTVTVASFGFKHGTPLDADVMFDVRFLKNPHYVEALRPYDGRNSDVEAYVMADERTGSLLDRLYDIVGWSLPHYVTEGKAYLTIAIGCTGGRHRSVVVAEKLGRYVDDLGYRVLVQHRDADKAPPSSALVSESPEAAGKRLSA